MTRFRAISLALFAFLLALVGVLPAAVSAGDDPRLTLSPTRGPQGTSVTATVQGVEREVTVTLYFNGSQVAQSPGLKDKGGAKPLRTLTFMVPATAPLGPAKVLATLGEGKSRLKDSRDNGRDNDRDDDHDDNRERNDGKDREDHESRDGREGWRSVTFTVTAPATATSVPATPTFTAVPPTATATFVPTATVTATSVPTETPVPPTATATATNTPEPTATATFTPVPPTATATATFTPEPTVTPTFTATSTPLPPTATPTFTPTATATPSGPAPCNGAGYPYANGGTFKWDSFFTTYANGVPAPGNIWFNGTVTAYCDVTSLGTAGQITGGTAITSANFDANGLLTMPNLQTNTQVVLNFPVANSNASCGSPANPVRAGNVVPPTWVIPAQDITNGQIIRVNQSGILIDVATGLPPLLPVPGPLPFGNGKLYLITTPLQPNGTLTIHYQSLAPGCQSLF